MKRNQKITLGEMRASGVRGLLIYCSDYHCSYWIATNGDKWPDEVRLSDLEPRFTCQAAARGELTSARISDGNRRPEHRSRTSPAPAGRYETDEAYGRRRFIYFSILP